jgi:hypothetical protein
MPLPTSFGRAARGGSPGVEGPARLRLRSAAVCEAPGIPFPKSADRRPFGTLCRLAEELPTAGFPNSMAPRLPERPPLRVRAAQRLLPFRLDFFR